MNSGTYISVELSKAQEAYDRAEVLGLLTSQNTNENKDNFIMNKTLLDKSKHRYSLAGLENELQYYFTNEYKKYFLLLYVSPCYCNGAWSGQDIQKKRRGDRSEGVGNKWRDRGI